MEKERWIKSTNLGKDNLCPKPNLTYRFNSKTRNKKKKNICTNADNLMEIKSENDSFKKFII